MLSSVMVAYFDCNKMIHLNVLMNFKAKCYQRMQFLNSYKTQNRIYREDVWEQREETLEYRRIVRNCANRVMRMYSPMNIMGMTKPQRMRQYGHVERTRKIFNSFIMFSRSADLEEKATVGSSWEDNSKKS